MANREGYQATKRFTKLEAADFCEHCSVEDLSQAVGYFYERDSFGLVSQYIVCEPCRVANVEAAGNQETTCHDCLETVLVKDTIEWKGYDFVMDVDNEPIVVCKHCQVCATHVTRVEKYKSDEEFELRQHQEQQDAEDAAYDDTPDDD